MRAEWPLALWVGMLAISGCRSDLFDRLQSSSPDAGGVNVFPNAGSTGPTDVDGGHGRTEPTDVDPAQPDLGVNATAGSGSGGAGPGSPAPGRETDGGASGRPNGSIAPISPSQAGSGGLGVGAVPVLVESFPMAGAKGWAVDAPLVLRFDRPILPGVGAITLVELFDAVTVERLEADSGQVNVEGAQATINWSRQYKYGTGYGLLIEPGAFEDEQGNSFEGISELGTLSFETIAAEGVQLQLDPAFVELKPISTTIALDFSGAIEAGPLGDVVLIDLSTGQVVGRERVSASELVVVSGSTLHWQLEGLKYGTDYALQVDSGAVYSLQGVPFEGFEAGAGPAFKTVPAPIPQLVGTSPSSGAESVDPAANLVLNFSEPVQVGVGNISVRLFEGDGLVEAIDVADPAAVTALDVSVTVNVSALLDNSTRYYVTVDSGAVQSLHDVAYPGFPNNTSFNFITADAPPAPLVLTGSSPADGATEVDAAADLTLIFSEAVVRGAGNVTVLETSDNAVHQTLSVMDPAVSVTAGEVAVDLAGPLDNDTEYYVTIGAGAFISVRGAAYPGIQGSAGLSFSTAAPFLVNELLPADDAEDASSRAPLTLTFSASVEAGAGTVAIYRTADDSLVEVVDVESDQVVISGEKAVVTLSAALIPETEYYVQVEAGAFVRVGSAATVAISGQEAWNFTTARACAEGYIPGQEDNCYFIVTTVVAYELALEACKVGPGWGLAAIESQAEQLFVEELVPEELWIGGNDLQVEGEWRWGQAGSQFWSGDVNGSGIPGEYANWADAQPSAGGQHCVRILAGGNNWQWADSFCLETHGFICEGPSG